MTMGTNDSLRITEEFANRNEQTRKKLVDQETIALLIDKLCTSTDSYEIPGVVNLLFDLLPPSIEKNCLAQLKCRTITREFLVKQLWGYDKQIVSIPYSGTYHYIGDYKKWNEVIKPHKIWESKIDEALVYEDLSYKLRSLLDNLRNASNFEAEANKALCFIKIDNTMRVFVKLFPQIADKWEHLLYSWELYKVYDLSNQELAKVLWNFYHFIVDFPNR